MVLYFGNIPKKVWKTLDFSDQSRYTINMLKAIEFLGVVCGIIGSFLVARGFLAVGFCLFFVSSICLFYSAIKQMNWNLSALQGTFLVSNILGVSNYVFGV
jgi:ABC-type multidrug transport system fused ATPase/permease subunit